MLLLTTAASHDAAGYKLDILLRRAATAGACAVVLTGQDAPSRVPSSAAHIAAQGGLTVLAADGPLTSAVLDAAAAVAGDAQTALRVLRDAPEILTPGRPSSVADACARLLGQPVTVATSTPPGAVRVTPIPSAGQPDRCLFTATGNGYRSTVVDVALALAAGAITRAEALHDWEERAPVRSSAALLAELILSAEPASATLTAARRVGVPVDGWHQVARFPVPSDIQTPQSDATDVTQQWQALELGSQSALAVAREDRGTWHAAQIEGAVLIIHSRHAGTAGDRAIEPTVHRVAAHLATVWRTAEVRVGIGSLREGVAGLKASAAEARAALAGQRRRSGHVEVIWFDDVGLQRVLRDWYMSKSAQDAVSELLAPLERLSPPRAHEAVRTLGTWLEEGGSAVATAARLYLHRNTVHYRITQIERILDVDLADPDTRLALSLACRARQLQTLSAPEPRF